MSRLSRLVSLVLLVAVVPTSRGQAPAPFSLVPAPGGAITYSAGATVTFTVPVVVTQTATSVTFTWSLTPPVPPNPPTPVPIQSGDLFILAVFDPTVPATPAQQAIRASSTIAGSLKATSATAKTTWVAADVTNPTYAAWMVDAKALGLPAVVVIAVDASNKGTVVQGAGFSIPPNATEADVVAAVKKIRGAS